MYAITIPEPGGPEALVWTEVPDPVPGGGEVLVELAAGAVNCADLLQRQGFYDPPPGPVEDANPDTTDWAHEYSVWLASAAYGRAQGTGDFAELLTLLPALVKQYRGWDKQFDAQLGLYWSVPVWDAMEYSASSYESGQAYHGGAGYRPTLNSYQYADAMAISAMARMAGDRSLADEYARRAADLKRALHKWLWDPKRAFYYTMPRDNNPDHELSGTREEIGDIPWMFGTAHSGGVAFGTDAAAGR